MALPQNRPRRPRGQCGYSSNLRLSSALGGGGWITPRPGRFTPGKDPDPLNRWLGRPKGRSGEVWKISPPTAFDPRTVQSVAGHHSDYAILARAYCCIYNKTLRYNSERTKCMAIKVSS